MQYLRCEQNINTMKIRKNYTVLDKNKQKSIKGGTTDPINGSADAAEVIIIDDLTI